MFSSTAKSHRFAALAALADADAGVRRRQLDAVRDELERLESQRLELGDHVRRYGRDGLARGRLTDSPALAHRRRFVAALAARVDVLGPELHRCEARLREAQERHESALAKGLALDAIRARHVERERAAAAREEQRRSDESWRAASGRARRGAA